MMVWLAGSGRPAAHLLADAEGRDARRGGKWARTVDVRRRLERAGRVKTRGMSAGARGAGGGVEAVEVTGGGARGSGAEWGDGRARQGG